MKIFKKLSAALLLAAITFTLFACGGTKPNESANSSTGYDGRVFDVSALQDGSLTVTSSKEDGGYSLIMQGRGAAIDYTDKKLVPWNVLSKQITEVNVDYGVEEIGDYFFFTANLESVTIPATVKKLAEHAFSPDTVVYSYSTTEIETENTIYYYREEMPDESDKYFHIVEGKPELWVPVNSKTYSFLFIGNSFTYYAGSEANPMIPYYFGEIAKDLGADVNVDFVVKGSHKLSEFASHTDTGYGEVVWQKLNNNQYDFIILQEHSTMPINDYEAFSSAVASLKKDIVIVAIYL